MEERRNTLTEAEWQVMEELWESAPRTGRELTAPRNSRVMERAYDAATGTNYVRYTLPEAEQPAASDMGRGLTSGGGKGGGGHGLS